MAKGKLKTERDELTIALDACANLFWGELRSIEEAEGERIRCRDRRVAAQQEISELRSRLDAARESQDQLPAKMNLATLADDGQEIADLQRQWRGLEDDIADHEKALRGAEGDAVGSYRLDIQRAAIRAREALQSARDRRRAVEEALDRAFEQVERRVEEVENLSRVYAQTG